jgi:N utilization substance protein B
MDLVSAPARNTLDSLWAGQLDVEALSEGKPAEDGEHAYTERLVLGIERRRDEIDALIEGASQNWRMPRMPVVDRNILRLCCFELVACPDVPASVAINEAVELAKRFGDKDSKAFVNGILDRVAAELGRGGRRHPASRAE